MINLKEYGENEFKVYFLGEFKGFLVKFDDNKLWCCYYLAKPGQAEEQYNGFDCYSPVDYEDNLADSALEILQDLLVNK